MNVIVKDKQVSRINVDEYISFEIKDGIMIGVFKQDIVVDIELARVLVKARLELCDGKDYPTLLYYDKFKYANKAVRDYMQVEGVRGIKAGAIITRSVSIKTFFNFYLAVAKLEIPTKVFNSEENAQTWLMQFVD